MNTQKTESPARTATPYLIVRGATEAIAFYQRVFGMTSAYPPMTDSTGRVAHAELDLDGARIMLADEFPESGILSPATLGGSPVMIVLTVDDVDAVFASAVAAGSKVVRPVADQPHGERSAKITDPFGHVWGLTAPITRSSDR